MDTTRQPPSAVSEKVALLRARFAALHIAEAERGHAARERWNHEEKVLRNQISAMEETIGLLEREVKTVTAQLSRAEKAEAAAAGGTKADTTKPGASDTGWLNGLLGSMPGALPGMARGSGDEGGGGNFAGIELLLGQLEDKLLRTQASLALRIARSRDAPPAAG